jgi:Plasmid pRiA4b ORF-3-like protein
MAQVNTAVTVYQLRILLRRTSPHVWRRIVIPSHFTLSQLHQTIRLLFGWSNAYPGRFVIRGKSFPADPTAAGESTTSQQLSEFQFYPRERFLYDYRFELQFLDPDLVLPPDSVCPLHAHPCLKIDNGILIRSNRAKKSKSKPPRSHPADHRGLGSSGHATHAPEVAPVTRAGRYPKRNVFSVTLSIHLKATELHPRRWP